MSVTVKDLRDLLATLPDDLEVRCYGGDYGARELEEAAIVHAPAGPRRYLWTYDTLDEAAAMVDEGEAIKTLVLLR